MVRQGNDGKHFWFGNVSRQGLRITFDLAVEDAFTVHFKNSTIKFDRNNKYGLYLYKPRQEYLDFVRETKNGENREIAGVLQQTATDNPSDEVHDTMEREDNTPIDGWGRMYPGMK